ncbi:MAG: twin-arginine translocase TatA/TatE family subunit [Thermodesulfovibrionales bacterium]|nr:twin-arginine translocase TatA/TatE family subunit [Thermodesulfovibrionales bacterium]
MFGLGAQELIIILIIVFLIFGASRLPELGKGIGQAIRNFKKSVSEPDEIDVTPKKGVEKEEKKEKEKEKDKSE